MKLKRLIAPCLVAAVATTGATRATADAADAAVGALVGGIIGHAIAKDQQRKRQATVRRSYKKPGISSAQRATNREMQTALNYFGFNAGAVDGAVGPGTRSAVSRYQAQMGYPASGWIQAHEHDFLLAAYRWASSGGAATSGATTPQGQLIAYRRVMSGQPAQPIAPAVPPAALPPTTTVVVTPQMTPQPSAPAATATTTVAAVPSVTVPTVEAPGAEAAKAAAGEAPVLPNFLGEAVGVSLASHCNRVSLLTNSNGGFVTEATMTDPAFALEEQFCLARTYAISEGEELAAKVQNFTPQQIAEQCEAFAPSMREYVSAVSLKPSADVVEEVSEFLQSSGMSPSQLAGTSKICLSMGYRTDEMDVALGSALVLVALGEGVYGELLGHHLSQGFGTSKRADLSLDWYQMGLDAVDSGSHAAFAPGQPSRQALIRKAAYAVGGAERSQVPDEVDTETAAIPAFAIAD
jgi:peptidoglycan hydrolase-like protein with peptidoglycan-binding domain